MTKTFTLEKISTLSKQAATCGGRGADATPQQNQRIETKTKIFNFTTTQVQVQETSIMQVSDKYFFDNSKRSSCQQQYSTASTNKDYNSKHEHPTVRKLSTKSMSNTPLAERRLPYFITA